LWNLYNPGNPGFEPSLTTPGGGTNYAIGGATTGTANFNTVNPTVVGFGLNDAFDGYGAAQQLQQFQQYLGSGGSFNPATSLFVVWLFPNDVFSAPFNLPAGTVPGSPGGANLVENGITNIATIIQTLSLAGAQHFLVPNVPDLGKIPDFINSPNSGSLSFLTATFNANLALALSQLDQALGSAEIVQFDTASLFAKLQTSPGAFGFENATESCVANLATSRCNPGNWDKWVFWDGAHPTTAAQQALAARFRAAIPEPTSIMLVAVALFSLAWARGQKRV
jgi:phospholipase/lecithinase/hemolysin